MTTGPAGALSIIVTAPVTAAFTFGVKVTLKVQVAPAATVGPQGEPPDPAAANSPLVAMLDIFSVVPELLVNVTVCAALVVPTADENVRLVGETTTGSAPVPVSPTICGLTAPPVLEMDTAPLIDPVPVGVNVTENVHFANLTSANPEVHGVVPLPTAE